MTRYLFPIYLFIFILIMIISYFLLRLETLSNNFVIADTLIIVLLPSLIFCLFCKRKKSFRTEFLYIIFIVSLALAYFIIPKDNNGFLKQIYFWIIPIVEGLFLLFVIFKIKKIVKNYKSINESEPLDVIQKLRLALRPFVHQEIILEILLQDIGIIYFSIFTWFKKPEINNKYVFTYHKTTESKKFVIVLLILALVDIVLFHYLIQLWSVTIAWIFTFLNIYFLLFIIAYYKSIGFLPHVLKDEYLIIRNGNKESVQFQLDNIESIKKAKDKVFGEQIPKDVHYFVMMFDSPQYEITLKNPVQMRGFYGIKKTITKVIFRLDQPNEFVDELNQKVSYSNSR